MSQACEDEETEQPLALSIRVVLLLCNIKYWLVSAACRSEIYFGVYLLWKINPAYPEDGRVSFF